MIAAQLRSLTEPQGISDQVYVASGYSNGSPFIELFQRTSNRVGFQLQGEVWRLSAQLRSEELDGNTAAHRRAAKSGPIR